MVLQDCGGDSSGGIRRVSLHHATTPAHQQEQPHPTFKLAPKFRAKEGWMGNHIFLCHGKLMLGSDAPLFYLTNAILLLGMVLHFGVV